MRKEETTKITLYHTSPEKIDKISKDGLFGSHLFFASEPYSMSGAEAKYTYKIEIDENEIIEACDLFFQDDADKLDTIVSDLAAYLEIEEDVATDLVDETISIFDVDCILKDEDKGEGSYYIQSITAQAAQVLGYRAVEVEDEQGTAYMINMLGFENELKLK